MEYSKDNVMTRKEYLKSKKKNKIDFSKIKYVLIIIVIILLSIYLFKQLDVYNNVTKIANKVVEETALSKTMIMYYVAEPYTIDDTKNVMLYKSQDESRTKISNTENLSNIHMYNDKLYGIKDGSLNVIDLTTYELTQIVKEKVKDFYITNEYIFYYIEDSKNSAIYKYEINTKKTNKIISGTIYQMLADKNKLYIISDGKTNKSIVSYDFNGKNKEILTDKYIVNYMYIDDSNIYFINSKDSKLYFVPKKGGDIIKLVDKKVASGLVSYKESVYYIDKDDGNALYKVDIKTKERKKIINKSVNKLQKDMNIIYYNLTNSIQIYKLDVTTGNTQKVTSARTNEYICKN